MAASSDPNRTVEATRVDGLSDATAVRHYDELTGDAKAAFPKIVDRGDTTLAPEIAAEFDDGEVVRFTDYYRVTLE